ncbi:MAG: hypothetical protein EOT05_00495 [Candidatus Microsaccharimonas sossegonensis]|uniref:Uncharacterized protein n=1 Tax=Candidatus Microsaccharimonas sossegonensis TaxID=2506948 RepID=A0A4Q0AGN2_9BACT|nr:MAG: hypothetical protein EOT05_00495 [Candidatus Microsaccharimonas sossegonensis]
MFLVGKLSWWYGGGWKAQVRRVRDRLAATAGYFSIGQLLATLFSPFRQISAGSVTGSAGVQLRAFFDKTLSRFIGAVVRLFTIFAGIVVLFFQCIFEGVILIIWLLLPAFPVVGLILFVVGWAPKWM